MEATKVRVDQAKELSALYNRAKAGLRPKGGQRQQQPSSTDASSSSSARATPAITDDRAGNLGTWSQQVSPTTVVDGQDEMFIYSSSSQSSSISAGESDSSCDGGDRNSDEEEEEEDESLADDKDNQDDQDDQDDRDEDEHDQPGHGSRKTEDNKHAASKAAAATRSMAIPSSSRPPPLRRRPHAAVVAARPVSCAASPPPPCPIASETTVANICTPLQRQGRTTKGEAAAAMRTSPQPCGGNRSSTPRVPLASPSSLFESKRAARLNRLSTMIEDVPETTETGHPPPEPAASHQAGPADRQRTWMTPRSAGSAAAATRTTTTRTTATTTKVPVVVAAHSLPSSPSSPTAVTQPGSGGCGGGRVSAGEEDIGAASAPSSALAATPLRPVFWFTNPSPSSPSQPAICLSPPSTTSLPLSSPPVDDFPPSSHSSSSSTSATSQTTAETEASSPPASEMSSSSRPRLSREGSNSSRHTLSPSSEVPPPGSPLAPSEKRASVHFCDSPTEFPLEGRASGSGGSSATSYSSRRRESRLSESLPADSAKTPASPDAAKAVELTPVDKIWGVLFDTQGQPTKRLREVMHSLSQFIIDNMLPLGSIVIVPEKLASFYSFHNLEGEPFPYGAIFKAPDKDLYRRLADLYQDLGCSYHLVQADPSSRPRIPALTPDGFTRWMVLNIQAFPDVEAGRLENVVSASPLDAHSALDGKSERLPKQLSRYLLPAKPDMKIRTLFQQAMRRHLSDVGGLSSGPSSPTRERASAPELHHYPHHRPHHHQRRPQSPTSSPSPMMTEAAATVMPLAPPLPPPPPPPPPPHMEAKEQTTRPALVRRGASLTTPIITVSRPSSASSHRRHASYSGPTTRAERDEGNSSNSMVTTLEVPSGSHTRGHSPRRASSSASAQHHEQPRGRDRDHPRVLLSPENNNSQYTNHDQRYYHLHSHQRHGNNHDSHSNHHRRRSPSRTRHHGRSSVNLAGPNNANSPGPSPCSSPIPSAADDVGSRAGGGGGGGSVAPPVSRQPPRSASNVAGPHPGRRSMVDTVVVAGGSGRGSGSGSDSRNRRDSSPVASSSARYHHHHHQRASLPDVRTTSSRSSTVGETLPRQANSRHAYAGSFAGSSSGRASSTDLLSPMRGRDRGIERDRSRNRDRDRDRDGAGGSAVHVWSRPRDARDRERDVRDRDRDRERDRVHDRDRGRDRDRNRDGDRRGHDRGRDRDGDRERDLGRERSRHPQQEQQQQQQHREISAVREYSRHRVSVTTAAAAARRERDEDKYRPSYGGGGGGGGASPGASTTSGRGGPAPLVVPIAPAAGGGIIAFTEQRPDLLPSPTGIVTSPIAVSPTTAMPSSSSSPTTSPSWPTAERPPLSRANSRRISRTLSGVGVTRKGDGGGGGGSSKGSGSGSVQGAAEGTAGGIQDDGGRDSDAESNLTWDDFLRSRRRSRKG